MSDPCLLVVVRLGFENVNHLNSYISSLDLESTACLITSNGIQALSAARPGVNQLFVIDCALDEATEEIACRFARLFRAENAQARIVRLAAIELEPEACQPFDDVVVIGHQTEYPRLGEVINQFFGFGNEVVSA